MELLDGLEIHGQPPHGMEKLVRWCSLLEKRTEQSVGENSGIPVTVSKTRLKQKYRHSCDHEHERGDLCFGRDSQTPCTWECLEHFQKLLLVQPSLPVLRCSH